MITLLNIGLVSIYAFIFSELYKNFGKKGRKRAKLSPIDLETPRDSIDTTKIIDQFTPAKRKCKRISTRVLDAILVSSLIVFFYVILVISANTDINASNQWAINFVFSWIGDLITIQVFKSLIYGILILFAINTWRKIKRKVKWVYWIVTHIVILKVKRAVQNIEIGGERQSITMVTT